MSGQSTADTHDALFSDTPYGPEIRTKGSIELQPRIPVPALDGAQTGEKKIMVRYVPQGSKLALKAKCDEYGEVVSFCIPGSNGQGDHSSYAFVEYQRTQDAVAAINGMNGLLFRGKRLHVFFPLNPAEPMERGQIHINHVPRTYRVVDLYEVFRNYGPITNVKLLLHQGSHIHKGIGFVRFLSNSAADLAKEDMNGRTLIAGLPPLEINYALRTARLQPTPLLTSLPSVADPNNIPPVSVAIPVVETAPDSVVSAARRCSHIGPWPVAIKNIGVAQDEKEISRICSQFGAIHSVKIMPATQQTPRFAWVNYWNSDEAFNAVANMNNLKFPAGNTWRVEVKSLRQDTSAA